MARGGKKQASEEMDVEDEDPANSKDSKSGKSGKNSKGKGDADKEVPKAARFVPFEALHENLCLLETSVANKDQNGLKRVLRKHTAIRRRISLADFGLVMDKWLPATSDALKRIHADLDAAARKGGKSGKKGGAMDVDEGFGDDVAAEAEFQKTVEKKRKALLASPDKASALPEVAAYLNLFAVTALMRVGLVQEAQTSVDFLLSGVKAENRRTLDLLQARAFHYKAQGAELLGPAEVEALRGELLTAHRTACLRLDEYGQATLINLILRSYCESNLVDQAVKFASKSKFPEAVSNNQQVRNLYYMGRLSAIQLDYSVSFQNLTQAIRKAPAHTALGFRVAVHKLATIVQLLMGDTPERSWFSDKDLVAPLQPYFELVKAVRHGSLADYDEVRKTHAQVFATDKVATLVVRLRNSVIRTGLRAINKAYSRISFKDISKRLALDSPESAELACAKAIRDGVIDAKIDHGKGHMTSSDVLDIYSTIEPQQAFHKRIQFCLAMHNDAVKAMRYPPDAHKAKHENKDGDDDDDANKPTDEELASEIERELEEDDDM